MILGPSGQITYSLELIEKYSSHEITIDKRERVGFSILHAYPVLIAFNLHFPLRLFQIKIYIVKIINAGIATNAIN